MALLTSQGQPWHLQGTLGWWGLFWQDLCLGLAALWLQDDNLGGYSALTLWLCINPEVVSSWGTPAEKQGELELWSHLCPYWGHLPIP